MSIEFDFSELDKLTADFREVQRNIGEYARKAVEISARRVKKDWRTSIAGTRAFSGGARSISYDLRGGRAIRGSSITAEVGPEPNKDAGSLVFIDEYGALDTAPRRSGANALRNNEKDFVEGIEKAAEDSMKAVDL